MDRSIDRWVDGPLGSPGALLDLSEGLLRLSWGPLGGLLGSLGALLRPPGGLLGLSWGIPWAFLSQPFGRQSGTPEALWPAWTKNTLRANGRSRFWGGLGHKKTFFDVMLGSLFSRPKVTQNDIRNDMKNEVQKTRCPGAYWKLF